MRVGLSWDLDSEQEPTQAWEFVLGEIEQADKMGFDSAWLNETRNESSSCPSPTMFLTYAARRTKNVQLRSANRHVGRTHPARVAEEIAVLDTFSRGRAGISFAPASAQGAAAGHVHETVDLINAAWACDEIRFRGDHIRFPAHTPDDVPYGASEPAFGGSYTPQWEWGPAMPDFLAVTPKPYATRPPVYVAIDDDETLEWAATSGIAPFVGVEVPTERAVARLARYRELADKAGRKRNEVEAVLERKITFDAAGDDHTLAGNGNELVCAIRDLRASTHISHLVWRRGGDDPMALYRFSVEVQTLIQA